MKIPPNSSYDALTTRNPQTPRYQEPRALGHPLFFVGITNVCFGLFRRSIDLCVREMQLDSGKINDSTNNAAELGNLCLGCQCLISFFRHNQKKMVMILMEMLLHSPVW